MLPCLAGKQKGPVEVDVEHPAPARVFVVFRFDVVDDACGSGHDVDIAKVPDDLREGFLHLRLLGHVAGVRLQLRDGFGGLAGCNVLCDVFDRGFPCGLGEVDACAWKFY